MTLAYELERLRVALEAVESAAATLSRRELPEWLAHRVAHIRAEAKSMRDAMAEHETTTKGEPKMTGRITGGVTYHIDNMFAHYLHARKKHPYFCDCLDPYGRTLPGHGVTQTLEYLRECNKKSVDSGDLGWHNLLECEIWEVYEALSRNDKEQAVEELYDAIAILLRTIDVLEGRQPLGRPEEVK